MKVLIEIAGVRQEAELADTPCAYAIYDALPFAANASTWGDEIYFQVPVQQPRDETAAEVVQLGDLGYWPPGRAFCIFFGPTPMSRREDEIRPASAVNIVGRLLGEPREFKKAPAGAMINVSKV